MVVAPRQQGTNPLNGHSEDGVAATGTERPRIAILGAASQQESARFDAALRQAGAEPVHFALNTIQQRGITWTTAGAYLGEIRIDNLGAVLIRNLGSEWPGRAAFDGQDDSRLSFAEWFPRACLQRDRHDTLLGLLMALEDSGVPLFNPPRSSFLARRKPYQLHLLRDAGCPTPHTMITNDSEQARAFLDSVGGAIAKPAAGGATTLAGEELDDGALAKLRAAPAMFQERVYGADLRVVVLDGDIISAAAIDVPPDTVDFRRHSAYQAGTAAYTTVELPPKVERMCNAASQRLGLRFAGFDIKRTQNGEHIFLEANSSPIYFDQESKTGHPITQRLAEHLVTIGRGRPHG